MKLEKCYGSIPDYQENRTSEMKLGLKSKEETNLFLDLKLMLIS